MLIYLINECFINDTYFFYLNENGFFQIKPKLRFLRSQDCWSQIEKYRKILPGSEGILNKKFFLTKDILFENPSLWKNS